MGKLRPLRIRKISCSSGVTRILAPSGTAIEAVGPNISSDESPEEVEGAIAYGADGDAVSNFKLCSFTEANPRILSDFKALDGADKCTFKFQAGTFKQKLPESWLDNNIWYISWTENADGTYTMNRIYWPDGDEAPDPRIPEEDLALYKAWKAKYPSTDAGSALYKEYPGPTAAKAELGASAGTPAPSGSTGASGSTSSSSTPAGNTGSSTSGTKASSGSATVKPAPAKQTAAQKKAAEQKAQKKALSRTKPAKPSVKAYRGHKVKVTFKAAKMPKGVKAKSYQVSYRQNGKTRTVTVSAKSYKTFKVTVKHLTKSRKYTFKVRAVAKIGGKTCYSAWSSYSKGIRAK